MFGLVLGALRARRAQTIALFALTLLAGLGASAAPWFLAWGRDAVADANIASAPGTERVVVGSGAVRYTAGGPSPLQVLRDRVGQDLSIHGGQIVVGAALFASVQAADDPDALPAGLYLHYRDGVCEQLTVEGQCPTGDGDVIISRATAGTLGLHIGDRVRFEGFRLPTPISLRISGLYDVTDPIGPYWSGTDLLSTVAGGTTVEEPAFVSESTMFGARPDGLDLEFHLVLPDSAFDTPDLDLAAVFARASADLRQANFEVETEATRLINRIARDRQLIELGITVAAAQLVLICWVGLFLAVRHTSDERRGDIGLLKLRGAAPSRIWALTAQQSALPMVIGAVLGWLLGYLAAAGLARSLSAPAHTAATDPVRSLWLSIAAAALACLGALASAVAAEWRALGAPVVALLRRVPSGHRGWRADVTELVVVLLALVGVYQGHAELSSAGEPSVLALLAPGLVGLAVALVVARTLPVISSGAGLAALRAGRPGLALAALHVGRRPGTHRVFAVLAVAAAVFTTATLFWQTATVAWRERAVQELGADRVLMVQADGAARLLAAVRAVDPEGRYAMAVARTEGPRTADRVVAVDASRLARVAQLSAGDLLHPALPQPPQVRDGPLRLDVAGPTGLRDDESVGLRLRLNTVDGVAHLVDFASLAPGRRVIEATVSGCVPSCRLVSLELVAPVLVNRFRPATVEVYGLAQAAGDVVTPAVLGDVTRWRPQLGPTGIGPVVQARDDRLALSLYTGPRPPGQRIDARVLPVSAPAPLPVVLAGARPEPRKAGDERITVLGGSSVPYQVIASVPVLPRVGADGVLVDLEYALRSNDGPAESAALEVWLTADAPESIVAGLAQHGVRVLAERTVTQRASDLAGHGPGLALRFQYFSAAVILLLAAGTVVVGSTVEHQGRVAELVALRGQGLTGREVAVAGYAGTGFLLGTALLTGVFSALVAQLAVTASLPVFADGWALLPLPSGVTPGSLGVAATTVLAVIGLAALAGAARLVGAVNAGPPPQDDR